MHDLHEKEATIIIHFDGGQGFIQEVPQAGGNIKYSIRKYHIVHM